MKGSSVNRKRGTIRRMGSGERAGDRKPGKTGLMGTFRRIGAARRWTHMCLRVMRPALPVLAAVLAVFSLTGCQSQKYSHLDLAQGQDGEEPVDIWIPLEENIVIEDEVEDELGAGALSGGTERGQGGPYILFSGDVLLSDHVLEAYRRGGGIQGVLDEGYRQAIGAASFFMVNEEFPFSDRGTQAADKEYTFRLPTERVSIFQEMGIDGVTLANNHALDFGQEALLDSCMTLDAAGILHTGAGENLAAARQAIRLELDGRRIAILGTTRVMPVYDWTAGKDRPGMLSAYDPGAMLAEVRSLAETADYVAVCIHWGIEKDEQPQEYQRTLARQIIDAGADLVVGSHPHVLQGVEYYKGKPIFYSLGNFVFGSSIPRTALLQVSWPEEEETGVEGKKNAEVEREESVEIRDERSAGTGNGENIGTGSKENAGSGEKENAGPRPEAEPVFRLLPGTSGAGYTHMLRDAAKEREFFQYMEGISFGVHFDEDGTVRPE